MKRKIMTAFLALLIAGSLTLSGSAEEITPSDEVASAEEMLVPEDVVSEDMTAIYAEDLKEGTYSIDVLSSSSMFSIIDCQLTVADGKMTAVMTMKGNGYLKLFMGTGLEAVEAEEEAYIPFELNEEGRQTYEVPVEALDMGIACAAWSKNREKWYDRTLVFSAASLPQDALQETLILTPEELNLEEGTYTVEGTLEGGSGKTTVESPLTMEVSENGVTATMIISSPNYSYVLVNEEKYEKVNTEGNSAFEIPVTGFDWKMPIKANSTAMGLNHEIDYTLFLDSSTILKVSDMETAEETEVKTTVSADFAAELPDGDYIPDRFSWTGGTGKVEITCDRIMVKEGIAYAELIFSSDSYTYVKVDGVEYTGTSQDGNTVFEIPVKLNVNNEILGMTTRMSAAHEIAYTVFPYLKAAEGETTDAQTADGGEAPELIGLNFERQLELDFAECFEVYFYEGDYALIDIVDSGQFLVVPEGAEVPAGLSEEIAVLQKPLDQIYLAATSAMALFRALDSLDSIRLSGTQAENWYVPEVAAAMESGEILFAGKYSEPDYELMLNEDCDLAVESTMILHTPKVKEVLEMLGIPVLMERASYEEHPLGRTEWIKLYGVLLDKEQEAEEFFEQQKKVLEEMQDFPNTEKTIAFFYVSTNGTVVVRNVSDYIPSMIELAGGRYIYNENWKADEEDSSVELTMEEFYAAARDADYLVYNATIAEELNSVEGLLAESELFADFKAVQEGNVWTTDRSMFQATDIIGQLIYDFHNILTGEDPDQMTFLKKVE